MRLDFASDNTAGMAPEALAALGSVNGGFCASYGADEWTRRAGDLIRTLLDVDAPVYFVATGTAANALALAAICRPIDAVIMHEHAHVLLEEAGAFRLFSHALGVIPVPGTSGRIDATRLRGILHQSYPSSTQAPTALSLANATEYGTVYGTRDFEELARIAKGGNLGLHVDGARLANAAAAGFDLHALGRSGVAVLALGGTKAGLGTGEAIVVLDPRLRKRFEVRIKQVGHVQSKSRFIAAPWVAMLESGAWLRGAEHANRMARELAARVAFRIVHPVDTNAVFVEMSERALARVGSAGWLVHRFADRSVRLMCSWATTMAAVEEIADALQTAAREQ